MISVECFCQFSIKTSTCIVDAIMSTHNIDFHGEIHKHYPIIFIKHDLSCSTVKTNGIKLTQSWQNLSI